MLVRRKRVEPVARRQPTGRPPCAVSADDVRARAIPSGGIVSVPWAAGRAVPPGAGGGGDRARGRVRGPRQVSSPCGRREWPVPADTRLRARRPRRQRTRALPHPVANVDGEFARGRADQGRRRAAPPRPVDGGARIPSTRARFRPRPPPRAVVAFAVPADRAGIRLDRSGPPVEADARRLTAAAASASSERARPSPAWPCSAPSRRARRRAWPRASAERSARGRRGRAGRTPGRRSWPSWPRRS